MIHVFANATFGSGFVSSLVIVSLLLTAGGLVSLLVLLARDWFRGELW